MGRITGEGDLLLDVNEAANLLKCTRRTVFNYLRRGVLVSHRVEGSKKTWLENAKVVGLTQIDKTSGSPESPKLPSHWKTLKRFHPGLFPELPDLP